VTTRTSFLAPRLDLEDDRRLGDHSLLGSLSQGALAIVSLLATSLQETLVLGLLLGVLIAKQINLILVLLLLLGGGRRGGGSLSSVGTLVASSGGSGEAEEVVRTSDRYS
jgi:hypothetical protein